MAEDLKMSGVLHGTSRYFTVLHGNIYIKYSYKGYTGLERPLGLQKVEAPTVYRKQEHESCKFVSLTHRPSLTAGDIPGTHFC
jgi:hypothetical protein